jgi:hypothetical protein
MVWLSNTNRFNPTVSCRVKARAGSSPRMKSRTFASVAEVPGGTTAKAKAPNVAIPAVSNAVTISAATPRADARFLKVATLSAADVEEAAAAMDP